MLWSRPAPTDLPNLNIRGSRAQPEVLMREEFIEDWDRDWATALRDNLNPNRDSNRDGQRGQVQGGWLTT